MLLADVRLPAPKGVPKCPRCATSQVAAEVVELLEHSPPFPFPQDTTPDGESLDVHGLSTKGCCTGWQLGPELFHDLWGSLHTMYWQETPVPAFPKTLAKGVLSPSFVMVFHQSTNHPACTFGLQRCPRICPKTSFLDLF